MIQAIGCKIVLGNDKILGELLLSSERKESCLGDTKAIGIRCATWDKKGNSLTQSHVILSRKQAQKLADELNFMLG